MSKMITHKDFSYLLGQLIEFPIVRMKDPEILEMKSGYSKEFMDWYFSPHNRMEEQKSRQNKESLNRAMKNYQHKNPEKTVLYRTITKLRKEVRKNPSIAFDLMEMVIQNE